MLDNTQATEKPRITSHSILKNPHLRSSAAPPGRAPSSSPAPLAAGPCEHDNRVVQSIRQPPDAREIRQSTPAPELSVVLLQLYDVIAAHRLTILVPINATTTKDPVSCGFPTSCRKKLQCIIHTLLPSNPAVAFRKDTPCKWCLGFSGFLGLTTGAAHVLRRYLRHICLKDRRSGARSQGS